MRGVFCFRIGRDNKLFYFIIPKKQSQKSCNGYLNKLQYKNINIRDAAWMHRAGLNRGCRRKHNLFFYHCHNTVFHTAVCAVCPGSWTAAGLQAMFGWNTQRIRRESEMDEKSELVRRTMRIIKGFSKKVWVRFRTARAIWNGGLIICPAMACTVPR